jgi:hypothetical protein
VKRGDINERRAGRGQSEEEEEEEKEDTAFSFVFGVWICPKRQRPAAGEVIGTGRSSGMHTLSLWLSLLHQQSEEKYAGYVART